MALAICCKCGELFDAKTPKAGKPEPTTSPTSPASVRLMDRPTRQKKRAKGRTPLVAAIDLAAQVADARCGSPVLGCVLLRPTPDGTLTIEATDVQDYFTATVPLDGIAWCGPPVAMPAKALRDLVRAGIKSVTTTTSAPDATCPWGLSLIHI